jgi:hypothetical protein
MQISRSTHNLLGGYLGQHFDIYGGAPIDAVREFVDEVDDHVIMQAIVDMRCLACTSMSDEVLDQNLTKWGNAVAFERALGINAHQYCAYLADALARLRDIKNGHGSDSGG